MRFFKRGLCALLAASMLTLPAFGDELGFVTGSYVFVRSGPGTSYAQIGGCSHGTHLVILGEEDGWYKVSVNGLTGYVSMEYVSTEFPEETTVATTLATTTVPADALYGTVTGSVVNVRAGAGSWHARVGQAKKGERVIILGEKDGWYHVSMENGQEGYISVEYIKPDTPAETTTAATTPATTTTPTTAIASIGNTQVTSVGKVTGSIVNLRASASTTAAIVGTAAKDDVLIVTGSTDGWYAVRQGGVQAYVHADYLAVSAPVNGTVSAPLVNLRAEASSSSEIVGTVANGTKLTVLKTLSGWYQVTNGTVTAFIVSDYLALGETPPVSTTEATTTATTTPQTTTAATTASPAGCYGTVTGSVVNLRSAASTTATIVGKANQGERYLIVAQDGDWYELSVDGQSAFIHSDYLELDDPDAFTTYGTITGATVNIRAGAATWHAKLGQVKKGEKVKILGEEDGWYKIETESGQIGFVTGEYVYIEPVATLPPETTASETTPPETTVPTESTTETTKFDFTVEPLADTGVITGSYVNLRELPTTESSAIALIAQGKYVEIVGKVGEDWYQVNYGSLSGYISATYVAPGVIAYTRPFANAVGGAEADGLISEFGQNDRTLSLAEEICEYAKTFIGTPYVYGGSLPETGFDCSGFTKYVYAHFGIEIPRMQQYDAGTRVSKENLRPGDLVFFNTTGNSISHVGMYIGYGQFIHAPAAGKTVCITALESDYYTPRYVCATRILN